MMLSAGHAANGWRNQRLVVTASFCSMVPCQRDALKKIVGDKKYLNAEDSAGLWELCVGCYVILCVGCDVILCMGCYVIL